MDRVLKRALSFVLALVMVLSLAPVAGLYAHAAEVEEVIEAEPTEEATATEPVMEPVTEPEASTEPEPAEEAEAEDEATTEPEQADIPADEVLVVEESFVSDVAVKAGTIDVTDTNIGLSWTDASNGQTLKPDNANWVADGKNVTGTATGYTLGQNSTASRAVNTTLTITNNYSEVKTLSFDYSLSGGGSVSGIISGTSGTYSADLAAGTSVTITLTSPNGVKTNTLTITNLQLLSAGDVTSTFLAPVNGSYTVDGAAVSAETTFTKAAAESYTLAATPADGYIFFGWYSEATQSYVSKTNPAEVKFNDDPRLKPVFILEDTAIFGVGASTFADLTEACEYAKTGAGGTTTVVLLNNGVLRDDVTIPAGVTLLIPHKDEQTEAYGEPGTISESRFLENCIDFGNAQGVHASWTKPTTYRELTLAADATIAVEGTIEVSAQHASAAAAATGGKYGGSPTGPIGYINMETGSQIVVKSGATLLCWGYIYGDGTVTAKSGAKVYENFQIMDFRGGNQTAGLATTNMVFPFSQYYVQNIEVATKFEYGASEYVATSLFASGFAYGAAIKFIGDGAMFRPESGAYVVKKYDPKNDVLNVETNGNCALAPITVDLSGLPIGDTETGGLDSGLFVLPITNNINITIKSGTANLKQSIMLLPGSSLTVDQGATLAIDDDYQLQVVDKDNWTTGYRITDDGMEWEEGLEFCYPGEQFVPIEYSPTKEKTRTTADLTDATVDINGTVITEGFMCSTVLWDVTVDSDTEEEIFAISGGGANIISSQKTGVLAMNGGAATPDPDLGVLFTYLFEQSKGENGSFYMIPMASAQLKNGDGTMLDTTGAEAGATYQYCKIHDAWYLDSAEDEHENCKLWDITWIVDGTDLTQEVPENTVPTYPKGTPTKEGYTFAGWSSSQNGPVLDELPAATGPATYYAIFTEVTDITVTAKGSIKYTVSGSVVTVNHSAACKVGYLKDGKYEAIPAAANSDGSYSFTAPAGVTEVLLVAKGDVTGDGKCNIIDRGTVAKHTLKTTHDKYTALSETWMIFAADINNNGKVDIIDRGNIAKHTLKTSHEKYVALTW